MKEKPIYFFALRQEVKVHEFISSIPGPEGSKGLAEMFEAIKNKKIEIQN